MTLHLFKGCVAWELQVGRIYVQVRRRVTDYGERPNLPLIATHYDPYGKWL